MVVRKCLQKKDQEIPGYGDNLKLRMEVRSRASKVQIMETVMDLLQGFEVEIFNFSSGPGCFAKKSETGFYAGIH